MRLVGDFKDERGMYGFHAFLLKEGIQNTFEPFKDPAAHELRFHIWIVEEDDFDKAYAFYEEFQKNPSDPRFQRKKEEIAVPRPPNAPPQKWKVRVEIPRSPTRLTLTNLIILVCALLYFINGFQATKIEDRKGVVALEIGLTPLQKALLFDYPQYLENFEAFLEMYPVKKVEEIKELPPEAQQCFQKLQQVATWKGFSELIVTRSLKDWNDLPPKTLFGKIREGQVWRLFTPCLLHGGLLHILFNMAWLWILGRQMEDRLGKFKMAVMIVITGIVANVAQYLMGGPIFLGFSGVVVGMVGFIWMRQKVAPWEGYPLQRPTIIFILVFVIAMLVLEIASMAMQFFRVTELSANIANTAHIVGGLVGIALARVPYFSRGIK
jgi:GlpG protein